MSKHTPGPWYIGEYCEIYGRIGSGQVAGISPRNDSSERMANACIIAAAPELLDALKDAVCALECCGKDYPAMTKASAAIAKATGEQK